MLQGSQAVRKGVVTGMPAKQSSLLDMSHEHDSTACSAHKSVQDTLSHVAWACDHTTLRSALQVCLHVTQHRVLTKVVGGCDLVAVTNPGIP
jgi:hypothetical protein